jgi:hypothetical protein
MEHGLLEILTHKYNARKLFSNMASFSNLNTAYNTRVVIGLTKNKEGVT